MGRKMKWLIPLLFFIYPIFLLAQQPEFEAYTDARQVVLNSYLEVSFTLKNANGTDFSPPDFKDFSILAGPSTSSRMQSINGVVSKEMSYIYTLQPVRAGKFTIGSASIKVGSRVLKTNPLQIEVIKGSQAAQNGKTTDEPVFIRMVMNKETAYPGEQILLEYKLYTSVSIEGFDMMDEPEYKGFYAMELKRYDSRTQREILNGKEYTTRVLRSIALFPQQTGTLTISPATIKLAVSDDNSSGGFFFNRSVRPLAVTTNELSLVVKPLPDAAPETFTGAVGRYEFQAGIDRNQATTDDAITLLMTIRGNGDMKRVKAPVLTANDTFEIYPPKLVDEQTLENQGELQGMQQYEYLLVPKLPGEFVLEPSFTFFDSDSKEYKTLTQGPYELTVQQGSNRSSSPDEGTKSSTSESDIRFIKLNTELKQNLFRFTGSLLFWGLAITPALLFLGLFLYKRKLDADKEADPFLLKMRSANKEARKRLAAAQEYMKSGQSRQFYDEISKASLGYVCSKLNIPLSELTKDNVLEKLQSLKVSDALTNNFMELIHRCEMAIFAGMDNAGCMEDTYQKAIDAISGIEKEIGKI